jgi:hypothetical protein
MIEAYTQVKIKFGKPAVKIEGIWFFVSEEVGTRGTFKAHPQDQFAYMTETAYVYEDNTCVIGN